MHALTPLDQPLGYECSATVKRVSIMANFPFKMLMMESAHLSAIDDAQRLFELYHMERQDRRKRWGVRIVKYVQSGRATRKHFNVAAWASMGYEICSIKVRQIEQPMAYKQTTEVVIDLERALKAFVDFPLGAMMADRAFPADPASADAINDYLNGFYATRFSGLRQGTLAVVPVRLARHRHDNFANWDERLWKRMRWRLTEVKEE